MKCEGSIEAEPEGCPFRTQASCSSDSPVSWTTGRVPDLQLIQNPEVVGPEDPTEHSTVFLAGGDGGYMNYRQDCGYGAYPGTASVDVSGWVLTFAGDDVELVEPQPGD